MPWMNTRLINVAALALMALVMVGCGYGFKQQGAGALPEGMTTLFIDKVENPTTEAWLGPALRTLLRDELTNRGGVRWADRTHADGLVTITIHSFTRSSTVKDDNEDTTKYSSKVTLSAVIKNKDTGEMIWSSGQIGSSNTYYGTDSSPSDLADKTSAELTIRHLGDLLSQGY